MSRKLASLFAVISWFSVIAQFVLMMQNRTASFGETIIRFFTFFTILTNTLAAICYTTRAAGSTTFRKAGTLTAITVYITIVGLVYQVLLRGIWEPTGLQRIVDEALHTVNPLLFILYWYLFEDKKAVHYRQVSYWLLYPLFYLAFVLLRGWYANFYPYPFVDVTAIGLAQTLLNSAALLLLFLLVSFGFVALGKNLPAVERNNY